MLRGMKTKKGAWVKAGGVSTKSGFPGSYGDYIYVRAPPEDYPKTDHQRRIGEGGRECAVKGKPGRDIHECIRKKWGK